MISSFPGGKSLQYILEQRKVVLLSYNNETSGSIKVELFI